MKDNSLKERLAGKLIGQGKTLEETKKEVGMTIESIDNILVAHELGKIHNIEMPIVEAVYGILYNGLKPEEAVNMLMNRARKNEDNDIIIGMDTITRGDLAITNKNGETWFSFRIPSQEHIEFE